jgi:threonine/homoserine/homoserine lactone efflux protein
MGWWLYLLQGIGLGVAIAAPVGPIGLLCIRRSLALGQWMGLATGLGAATADGVYGCIAGFGLTAIADSLVAHSQGLKIIGGLFLCYLGLKTVLSPPPSEAAHLTSRGMVGAYASTFVLTLTNPATILSFIAIFAGLGLVEAGRSWHLSLAIVSGVFLGSALWWFLLSWGVTWFRHRLNSERILWLNRLAGMVIVVFGVIAIGSGLKW